MDLAWVIEVVHVTEVRLDYEVVVGGVSLLLGLAAMVSVIVFYIVNRRKDEHP